LGAVRPAIEGWNPILGKKKAEQTQRMQLTAVKNRFFLLTALRGHSINLLVAGL